MLGTNNSSKHLKQDAKLHQLNNWAATSTADFAPQIVSVLALCAQELVEAKRRIKEDRGDVLHKVLPPFGDCVMHLLLRTKYYYTEQFTHTNRVKIHTISHGEALPDADSDATPFIVLPFVQTASVRLQGGDWIVAEAKKITRFSGSGGGSGEASSSVPSKPQWTIPIRPANSAVFSMRELPIPPRPLVTSISDDDDDDDDNDDAVCCEAAPSSTTAATKKKGSKQAEKMPKRKPPFWKREETVSNRIMVVSSNGQYILDAKTGARLKEQFNPGYYYSPVFWWNCINPWTSAYLTGADTRLVLFTQVLDRYTGGSLLEEDGNLGKTRFEVIQEPAKCLEELFMYAVAATWVSEDEVLLVGPVAKKEAKALDRPNRSHYTFALVQISSRIVVKTSSTTLSSDAPPFVPGQRHYDPSSTTTGSATAAPQKKVEEKEETEMCLRVKQQFVAEFPHSKRPTSGTTFGRLPMVLEHTTERSWHVALLMVVDRKARDETVLYRVVVPRTGTSAAADATLGLATLKAQVVSSGHLGRVTSFGIWK